MKDVPKVDHMAAIYGTKLCFKFGALFVCSSRFKEVNNRQSLNGYHTVVEIIREILIEWDRER